MLLKRKSTLTKTLAKANKQLKALSQERKDILKEVTSSLKELITNNDMFREIRWTQYTPYFNDGAACEFQIGSVEVLLTKDFTEQLDSYGIKPSSWYEDENTGGWLTTEHIELDNLISQFDEHLDVINFEHLAAAKKILSQLSKVPNFLEKNTNAMHESFGDHAMVTISKKGIKVEAYEHD